MLQVLLLILILSCSTAFAQMPDSISQSRVIDEFGTLPSGDMKARFDSFVIELSNDPASKGSIIIYGSEKESVRLQRFFKTYMRFRAFPDSRISLIKGGHFNDLMVQFWLTPLGAEDPPLKPAAYKFDEIGIISSVNLKRKIETFFSELNNEKDSQGYIFNYGTPKAVANREKLIRNLINFRRYDSSKITLMNGGKTKNLKTVLWIIPENAEVPEP